MPFSKNKLTKPPQGVAEHVLPLLFYQSQITETPLWLQGQNVVRSYLPTVSIHNVENLSADFSFKFSSKFASKVNLAFQQSFTFLIQTDVRRFTQSEPSKHCCVGLLMCKDVCCLLAGASNAIAQTHVFPSSQRARPWHVGQSRRTGHHRAWVTGFWPRTSSRGQVTAAVNLLEIQSMAKNGTALTWATLYRLACPNFVQKLVCPAVCSTIKQERQLELGFLTFRGLSEPVIYEKIN